MRHFETVIYTHNEAKQTTGHWLSSCWFKTHYTRRKTGRKCTIHRTLSTIYQM